MPNLPIRAALLVAIASTSALVAASFSSFSRARTMVSWPTLSSGTVQLGEEAGDPPSPSAAFGEPLPSGWEVLVSGWVAGPPTVASSAPGEVLLLVDSVAAG